MLASKHWATASLGFVITGVLMPFITLVVVSVLGRGEELTKNLPKCNYPIPDEDLAEYNAILDSMDSKDYLLVSRVTDAFLTNKLQKSKQYRTIDLKKDMKKKCLKTKEYIHSLGEWNEYIEYLKKEICKCGSKD